MSFLDRFRRRTPPSPGTPPAAGRAPDAEGPSIDQQRADAVAAAEATIHPGFVTRADASSWLVDVLQDDPATYPDLTPQAAVEITEAAWTRLAAAQAAWSDEGDYPHVRAAFEELEGRGVLARMNFACCQTCGHSEMDDERREDSRGYTFFHEQDSERLAPDGGDLYLAFGALRPDPSLDPDLLARSADGEEEARSVVVAASEERIAAEVVEALQRHGLTVDWDGTNRQRIRLPDLRWRKRLPAG